MDLLLDFETYCDLDLKKVSVQKYVTHPSFKVLCMYYTEFDPKTMIKGETFGWNFQDPQPLTLRNYEYYWAFNAGFDFNVYLNGPIEIGLSDDLKRWKDVQVLMSKFSLPQSLKQAAEVLKTPIKKNPDGNLLINRCCKKNSNTPSQGDYQGLFNYCGDDVDATFEVMKACPSMVVSETEWALWRETVRMNLIGIPIDFPAVEKIKERVDSYKIIINEMLPEITGGAITTPNQHARIKKFLNDRGVKVKNTTADTIEKLMEQEEREPGFLPEDCRQLLEIRQAAGASSVAKFDKLLDMRVGDRVHDFLRYGATNTQRWAGAGYQVHSLPKKSVKDPEELIERFMNMGDIENPIQSAKALCRSVIKAPSGQLLYQGDYSSIEYLLLIWSTDMTDMLQMFKEEKSAYIDMAAYLFDKKYEEIDKYAIDNLEYFLGKQVILGCGYQMGAPKFQATCERYGVEIDLETAERAVKGYRKKYRPITKMWTDTHKACIAAVQNPGSKYTANKCDFVCLPDKRGTQWLIITLASGTKLFYNSPDLTAGKYGIEIKHMGLTNYQWVHRFLSPGRIVENIIQKLARDLMGYSILEVAKDPTLENLMTVHDELVCIGTEFQPEENHKHLLNLMQRTPEWAKTIPLRAGGFYGRRYKKD